MLDLCFFYYQTVLNDMSVYSIAIPLSLFGGYTVISLVLLRFPSLVHRKKSLKFRKSRCHGCRLIAHRGGAGDNLENTMTAYNHAMKLDYDMLEIDCQFTCDKQVVVAHDDILTRVSDQPVSIKETEFDNLPKLSNSIKVQMSNGDICISESEDRNIPLLYDVLKTFPGVPLNIDIKREDDELISKVSNMVKEFEREDITVWGNFRESVVKKCYKENPNIPLCFSVWGVTRVVLQFYFGLLPFCPIKEQFLEIPMPSVFSKYWGVELTKFQRFLVSVVDFLLMSKCLFSHLKKRGIEVYLWVLNEEDDWERALRLGVSGIMTDYPTQLKNFMETKNHVLSNGEKERLVREEDKQHTSE
ncbi:lysophospholipase D GDPD1-like [Antedon mediterranea]|uniref:lysophospholipase D GDPD1-like n=1 Tax=Antedon mediterranea TaxID=105859 RepID=UPI003AF6E010